MTSKDIDFDKNYGVSFKFTISPDEYETISLVTPENGNAWTDWEEAPIAIKEKFKNMWVKGLFHIAEYKLEQIKKHMVN